MGLFFLSVLLERLAILYRESRMKGRAATRKTRRQAGGGCPCASAGTGAGAGPLFGGYRATARNRELLAKLRRGESIGFTATASLKAKGLIPRTSRKYRGKKILGPKYR